MAKSQGDTNTIYDNVYLTLIKRYHIAAVSLFAVLQQLYFSQQHQYLHLAIIFVYLLFSDFYKENYRKTMLDGITSLSVFGCALVSVIEKLTNQSLSYLYFLCLLIAIISTFFMFLHLLRCIRTPEKWRLIKEKFSKDFSRSTVMVVLIIILIECVLVVALSSVLFLLLT